MADITVNADELTQVADYRDDAAAEAAKAVEATASIDLNAVLYQTHGPISGPSNSAVTAKTAVREDAGRAVEEACRTLAAALNAAATWYTATDWYAAEILGDQMRS